MKVFFNGSDPNMVLSVCPAGHLPSADCPREWFGEDAVTPLSFTVNFRGGEAVVEHSLGRYLCAQKLTRSTKLIMPGQQHRTVLAA